MKINQKQILSNLKHTGLNFTGAAIGYAAVKNVPGQFQAFSGPLVLGLGVLSQLSSNSTVREMGSGAAIIGAIQTGQDFIPESLQAGQMGTFIPTLGEVDELEYANSLLGYEDEYDAYEVVEDDEDYAYDNELLDTTYEDVDDQEALEYDYEPEYEDEFLGTSEDEELAVAQSLF